MDSIYQILTWAFGGTSLLGAILSLVWWKKTKRLKEAEVKQKEAEAEKIQADADEAEVSRLLNQVDHQQKTIENLLSLNSSLSERLSMLNQSIDNHIDRNRELSDRAYKSETEINRINENLLAVTEERDKALRLADYNKIWRCERTDCQDPRGPKPPREKLKGLEYDPPKRAVTK